MFTKKILFFILLPLVALLAQDSSQTFLSVSRTGVQEFLNQHPDYDGRGTIIFVFDTGVDMGIDGLEKTSTGQVKVIDVQDFTGEGDIKLYDCKIIKEDGRAYFINKEENYKVAGADSLSLNSIDDKYFIGALDETKFKNSTSGAEDLNGNGKTDDKYYVVVFRAKDGSDTTWVAYFDTNDNGNLADEKPIRNYKEKFDTFTIPNAKGLNKLTFAINIFPDKKILSLHYDDGAHGTHVAGIAAGYHIDGSFINGVAPGANIISLKIGNNNFAGGATVTGSMKKAFLYADSVSKVVKKPCIVNMSFGIGSEIEGRSEMELFLDTLLNNNPYLYICVANGNDGPGISTAGLPASSNYVLSTGAVLAQEVGRDLYGSTLKKDIVLFFSSRGGEVSKPDICSPGACISTIPNWMTYDRFWGTSMASPYTAGVVSLILSGMEKEYPNIKIPSLLLYKAIRNSATPMEGYTPLDEGAGYINVINAFKLLKKYVDEGELKRFESYTTSSFAPNMPGNKAPNLYIRDGNYLTGNETYTFTIRRNNFQKNDKFYRIYNIKSSSDWLIPIQKKTYIRNNQETFINVKLDKKKLSKPDLYVAKITATRDDKTNMPEFSALATVVIPYSFDKMNGYTLNWNDDSVNPGMIKRYFIEVPDGQSAMSTFLSAKNNEYARIRFRLFAPDGENLFMSPLINTQTNDNKIEKTFYGLKPGVYELDVEGFFLADHVSIYNLKTMLSGVNRINNKTLDSTNTEIHLVNSCDNFQSFDLSGKILGYQKSYTIVLNGQTEYDFPFTLTKDEASKEFTVNLSKEDFNKVTDFSILVYNNEGKAIEKDGLSYKDETIRVKNSFNEDTVHLTLSLIPAFAIKPEEMQINLEEKTLLKNPGTVTITDNNIFKTVLYPFIPRTLQCLFNKPNIILPEGAKFFGKVYLDSNATNQMNLELPILFNF
jgi:subtilisin family serine protease